MQRAAKISPHGVVTRVLGHATYDLDKGAFQEFEMLALGRRWGFTTYNVRQREAQPGPIGFVFQLAPQNAPPIAPAFIGNYGVEWVKRPLIR